MVLFFDLTPERVTDDILSIITPKDSMRERAKNLRGNKKRHGIYTKLMEMKTALAVTGKSKNFVIVCFSSVILFAVGAFVAVLIDNLFLLPALSISLALVPFIYTANTLAIYEKTTKEELETTLSILHITDQQESYYVQEQ